MSADFRPAEAPRSDLSASRLARGVRTPRPNPKSEYLAALSDERLRELAEEQR